MSTLTESSSRIGAPRKKPNLEMFLKPCQGDRVFYRVRLLNFTTKQRDWPHITRFVHSIWDVDKATGKKRLNKIVCPTTPWIDGKNAQCKICAYSGKQFAINRESHGADPTAGSKGAKFRKKFEAIIPVYVVNDPNYEGNNNKFKVFIIDDQKTYEDFLTLIRKQSMKVPVFNGVNAVDCCFHVSVNAIPMKNGGTFNKTVIDKFVFTTEPKTYPAITSENIDNFPFDDTYFVKSEDYEINDFYNKYCVVSNDDIPEDDDIPVYSPSSSDATPAVDPVKIPQNDIPDTSTAISDEELDKLVLDSPIKKDEETKEAAEEVNSIQNSDVDTKDILEELGI